MGFEGCLSIKREETGEEREGLGIILVRRLTMFVLLKFNCFSPHCFPTLLQIVSQERAFISRFIIVC